MPRPPGLQQARSQKPEAARPGASNVSDTALCHRRLPAVAWDRSRCDIWPWNGCGDPSALSTDSWEQDTIDRERLMRGFETRRVET